MRHDDASEWWQNDNVRGELEQVLTHINHASSKQNYVERCYSLFDALNALWQAHRRATQMLGESDSGAIKDLLTNGIPARRKRWLCESCEVTALASFKPPILNHDTLRKSRLYRPNQPIPDSLQRKAALEHRQLVNAWQCWTKSRSDENRDALLKKLAQMLYVIRSNLAHGEKTAKGPDLQKVERDQKVCSVTIPVLEALFETLFDCPASRLAAYGTLLPGQPNAAILADMQGVWKDGSVRGVLEVRCGLPGFVWNLASEPVQVKVFISADLKQNWKRLDEFEGPAYRRILVPVDLADREVVVAYIYQAYVAGSGGSPDPPVKDKEGRGETSHQARRRPGGMA